MQPTDINKDFINHIRSLIDTGQDGEMQLLLDKLHPADIAEIFEELNLANASFVYRLLDNEVSADVLVELDEDDREKLLSSLTSKEIAEEIIENIDSDDAADMIAELPDEKQKEVISLIEDKEQAEDIKDLMTYEEGSAGSIMAKELIQVSLHWTIAKAIREMRIQAEEVENIYTIYVVDNENLLKGRLSLKKLLFSSNSTRSIIKDIYEEDELQTALVSTPAEEIAGMMEKYDLIVLPIVDEKNELLGRITIDDAVDVIRDEAEKDYQMASGISEDVEHDDNIWELTRARIPWLLIGMAGGLAAAQIIGIFDISENVELALFVPLIIAMGGNVGVQSAAIVVQGIANNSLKQGNTIKLLLKEFGVGLFNGIILSIILFAISQILGYDYRLSLAVSVSLVIVITFAALFGTFVPITLNKYKIDPAVATGPFITTANDVFGLIIYFWIAKVVFSYFS